MKQKLELAVKNVLNRPMRSTALVLLMAFLSFTAFSVTIVISSLQKGFTSLEERLGADIMVVPYEAGTRSSLTDIVLQGNTGYFYMNGEVMDKIASMDGIGRITAQYYCDDLSLAEIAENEGISRQGVRHTIKRAEEQLRFYEEKLGLAAHFADIREKAEEIGRLAASLSDDRDETVRDAAEKIAGAAEKIVSIF